MSTIPQFRLLSIVMPLSCRAPWRILLVSIGWFWYPVSAYWLPSKAKLEETQFFHVSFSLIDLPENIETGEWVITIPPCEGLDICLIGGSDSFDDSGSVSYYQNLVIHKFWLLYLFLRYQADSLLLNVPLFAVKIAFFRDEFDLKSNNLSDTVNLTIVPSINSSSVRDRNWSFSGGWSGSGSVLTSRPLFSFTI